MTLETTLAYYMQEKLPIIKSRLEELLIKVYKLKIMTDITTKADRITIKNRPPNSGSSFYCNTLRFIF